MSLVGKAGECGYWLFAALGLLLAAAPAQAADYDQGYAPPPRRHAL